MCLQILVDGQQWEQLSPGSHGHRPESRAFKWQNYKQQKLVDDRRFRPNIQTLQYPPGLSGFCRTRGNDCETTLILELKTATTPDCLKQTGRRNFEATYVNHVLGTRGWWFNDMAACSMGLVSNKICRFPWKARHDRRKKGKQLLLWCKVMEFAIQFTYIGNPPGISGNPGWWTVIFGQMWLLITVDGLEILHQLR